MFTLEQATNAQRGSRGIALLFLDLGTSVGVGGERHAPSALPQVETQYPLYRTLDGSQGRSGRVRENSRSLDRPGSRESPYRLSCLGPHVAQVGF